VRRAAPRITRIEDLASSALFSLEEIDVEFGNGSIRTFERWKERWPHTVIMVAVNEAQEVLLVWEFVAGLGRRVLRLPSGRVERGESPASAARRELCEEVAFDSGRHRIIHRFYNEPGHSDAFSDVVLLTDLRPGKLTGDEPEPLRYVAWPLQEIHALIEGSRVSDVRTIAALFLAELVLRGSTASSRFGADELTCPPPGS
jgi:ADP-ribose diphosphatase